MTKAAKKKRKLDKLEKSPRDEFGSSSNGAPAQALEDIETLKVSKGQSLSWSKGINEIKGGASCD